MLGPPHLLHFCTASIIPLEYEARNGFAAEFCLRTSAAGSSIKNHVFPSNRGYGTALSDAIAQSIPAPAQYLDSPYHPDSSFLPVRVNANTFALWGSSTPAGLAGPRGSLLSARGKAMHPLGVGGDRWEHTAARLGSDNELLTFPANTVSASGASSVTMNLPASFQAMPGFVVSTTGERIRGTLSAASFTRETSGSTATVSADTPFYADAARARRNDVFIINTGKNNLSAGGVSADPATIESAVLRMVTHQAALGKRVLVLGQFINTGTTSDAIIRGRTHASDAMIQAALGDAFLDTHAWLTGPQVWADTSLVPTSEDLAEQALGNKPPSVSADSGHLNAVGLDAYARLILAKLDELGWMNANSGGGVGEPVDLLFTSDKFTGGDVASIVGRTSDAGHGGEGKSWIGSSANALRIAGGQLAVSTTPETVRWFAGFEGPGPNVAIRAKIASLQTGSQWWMDVRRPALVGIPDCYRIEFNLTTNTARLQKRVGGTATYVTGSTTFKVGDWVELRAVGSTISLLVNGVPPISTTDTDITTGSYVGFGGTPTSANIRFSDVAVQAY